MKLVVGEPVARDDGRFYVPVSRAEAVEGVPSQIVFRVASDAFQTLAEAQAFAEMVVGAVNTEHNKNAVVASMMADISARNHAINIFDAFMSEYIAPVSPSVVSANEVMARILNRTSSTETSDQPNSEAIPEKSPIITTSKTLRK